MRFASHTGRVDTTRLVEEYLERIGAPGVPDNGFGTLAALQYAHLTSVPFENLDVHSRSGVRTDIDWSIPKIVERQRGGWCFENNGAFGWLLEQLGFAVSYMGAYVLLDPPDTTHMSHLCLLVTIDQPYLVDVGFGDSFIRPLPITGERVHDGNAIYRVTYDAPWFNLAELNDNIAEMESGARPLYRFERVERSLTDFDSESKRLQAGSMFTDKPFATRLLGEGSDRVTLLADRLKIRRNGIWTETAVAQDQWTTTYREWFGGRT